MIEPAAVCVAGRASAGPWLFYMAPMPLGYAAWLVQESLWCRVVALCSEAERTLGDARRRLPKQEQKKGCIYYCLKQ